MRILTIALLLTANAAMAEAPTAAKTDNTPPQSVWRLTDGNYEHLQSGLPCPSTLAHYQRQNAMAFDRFGLDVGCNYQNGPATLTYYLTRRETQGGLDAAMDEAKRELLEYGAKLHPRLMSETTTRLGDLDWKTALYAEDGDIRSAIWISDLSGWTFEYRVTYPVTLESAVLADMTAFTAAVRSSAGARLALCAKAAQPERNGTVIADPETLRTAASISSVLGGATLAAAEDEKQKKRTPPTAEVPPPAWCVDKVMSRGDFPMTFWRSVKSDATTDLADRVSLMTEDQPPVTLDITSGGAEALVAAEISNGKSESPARWIATLQDGDRTLIFGYFAGRPSADLAADLFARILSGKQKYLGGYSAKGKNINIIMPPS